MKPNSRLKFLTLIVLSLTLLFTASAYAEMSETELSALSDTIGVRTYLNWDDDALASQFASGNEPTLSASLDWLESFAEEEVGNREVITRHVMMWLDIIGDNLPTSGLSGTEFSDLKDQVMDNWKDFDKYQTPLDYYGDRIYYVTERMRFLVEELRSTELEEATRERYELELSALEEESETLQADFLAEKDALQTGVDAYIPETELQDSSSIYNQIWEKAEPLIIAETEWLEALENPDSGANNIHVTIIDKTEFAIQAIGQEDADIRVCQYNKPNTPCLQKSTGKSGGVYFRIADFKPNKDGEIDITYTVTKDGFRKREVQHITLVGGGVTRCVMIQDNAKPYFSMLSWNERDMLNDNNKVFFSTKNDEEHTVSLKVQTGGADRKVAMLLNGKEMASKTVKANTSEIVTFKGKYLQEPAWVNGGTLAFSIGDEKQVTRLQVVKGYIEEPSNMQTAYALIQKIMSFGLTNFPVTGGGSSKLDASFLGDQVSVQIDPAGTLTITVSPEKLEKKFKKGSWKSADQILLDDYKKDFNAKSVIEQNKMKMDIASQTIRSKEKNFLGKSGASVKFEAEAVLSYTNKDDRFSGGITAAVTLAYKYEVTKTVFFGHIPVYFGFDAKASLNLSVSSEISVKSNFTDFEWTGVNITAKVHLEVGVSAGIGIKGICSIGVRGYAFVEFAASIVPPKTPTVKWAVGVKVELVFLFYTKTWNAWSYPPKSSEGIEADPLDDPWEGWTDMATLSTISDEEAASLTDDSVTNDTGSSFGITPKEEIKVLDITNMTGNSTRYLTAAVKNSASNEIVQRTLVFRVQNLEGRPRIVASSFEHHNDAKYLGVIDFGKNLEKDGHDTDRFDYAFDVDTRKIGDKTLIAMTLLSGTRTGISDKGTEEDLLKASEQTKVYSLFFELKYIQGSGVELKLLQVKELAKATTGTRLSLPRVRMSPVDNCAFSGWYEESNIRDKDESKHQHQIKVNQVTNSGAVYPETILFSSGYSVIDFTMSDTGCLIDSRISPYTAILVRTGNAQNTILFTARSSIAPHHSIDGIFTTLDRLDVYDAEHGRLLTKGFVFLSAKNASGEDQEMRGNLTLASLTGSQLHKESDKYNDLTMTVKPTTINVGTDRINSVSLINNDKKVSPFLYLYWPQSIEEVTIDGQKYKQNVIRACLVDYKNALSTPAFTFLDLKNFPHSIYLDRLKSYYSDVNDISSGWYTMQRLENLSSVYEIDYRSSVSVEILGATSENPVAAVGEKMDFLFSLKNNGNLVVDKAKIRIEPTTNQGGRVELEVNFKEPIKNKVTYIDTNDQVVYEVSNETDAYGSSVFYQIPSLGEAPGGYDMVVEGMQVITGDGEPVTSDPAPINLPGILPGETATFKGLLERIPVEWHGNTELKASVITISGSPNMQTKEAAIAAAAAETVITDPVYDESDIVYTSYEFSDIAGDDAGTCEATYTDKNGDSVSEPCGGYADYVVMDDSEGVRTDQISIYEAPNDLGIEASVYSDENGDEMLLAQIENDGGLRSDAQQTPTFLVKLDDVNGTEQTPYSHTFRMPITDRFSYALNVPLSDLTDGMKYESLKVLVNGQTAQFDDFNPYDSEDVITAQPYLAISGPQSLTVKAGAKAVFSVSAEDLNGKGLSYQWQYRYKVPIVETDEESSTSKAIEDIDAVNAEVNAASENWNWQWVNIPGATEPTLTIDPVTRNMNGRQYWCVVYDSTGAGRMSEIATLNVSGQQGVIFFPLFEDNKLPATGFSTQAPTALAEMPASINYEPSNMRLMIPAINIDTKIITVPNEHGSYPIQWLGANAGLLEGSSEPGEGVSYITGHNHLNTTEAGPFAMLSALEEGDRIFVTGTDGSMKTFSVYDSRKIGESDLAAAEQMAGMYENSLTLITCEDESVDGGYANRRIVCARPMDGA